MNTSVEAARQFLRTVLEQMRQYGEQPEQIDPLWAPQAERFDETLLQALPIEASARLSGNHSVAIDEALLFFLFGQSIAGFPYGNRIINVELAIAAYHAILNNVVSHDLLPVQWATTTTNLAIAYSNRIRGERADNRERVIELYHQALQVYTLAQFPVEWASTTSNLALAYYQRIRGERVDNLEWAIDLNHQALQVYTLAQFPVEWAVTISNLATAYGDRIRGERADNLERAIDLYHQALQVHIQDQFPVDWALITNNLAGAYYQRIRGERADNLERAIDLNHQALQVHTQDQFPVDWALTISNLATAYSKRIRGERADNLERAIELYHQALQVYTQDQFPVEWAVTISNLAGAYCDRIRGERADNLERAINLNHQALQVRTQDQFPVDWASTTSLAGAYHQRIRGERADNLERAIELYHQALQVRTQDQFPVDWALITNNLAGAYRDRIRGDRADNLERAIELYHQALQVYTQDQFPVDWAATTSYLAAAYCDRIRGERADNLERAINLNHQALQVRTQDQFPVDWALTTHNLATAYYQRIRGERADNLERAINLNHQALQVRTQDQFPVDWALTTHNLATAYYQRIRGERADNRERAIKLCHQALQVRTQDQFPVDWALTTHNLATAYYQRIRGERADNLERAIALNHQALQVYTPEAFPLECYQVGRSLGDLGFSQRNWRLAMEAYSKAMAAIERSRSWATNETSRQEIQAGAARVYSRLVEACVKAGNLGKAQESVERSRSRRLVELMAINAHYDRETIPPQTQTLLTAYETLQQKINALRFQLVQGRDAAKTEESVRGRAALGATSEQIADLEGQKQALRQQISRLDPVSAGQLEVSPPALADMQQLIDAPTTALLSFYTTAAHSYIFVLRQNQVACHTLSGEGRQLQAFLLEQWLQPYLSSRSREAWQTSMPHVLQALSEKLQLEELIQIHLQGIEELILIPHFELHQIPFAALPTSQGLLGDRFQLRVVPSCQVLQFCHQRPPLEPTTLGIVENASEDLPCAAFEAETIAKLNTVPPALRLRGSQEATVARYKQLLQEHQVHQLLSSHHAQSRLDKPLESTLQLADGVITLGELLSPAWRLPDLCDVFLSCCETGLGYSADSTDDIVTLATGFLCAGARSVVSTLWSVDDLATAIFSILYHQNQKQQMDRPQALQAAQQTLRTMTGSQLQQTYYTDLVNMLDARFAEVKERRKRASSQQENEFWGNVLTGIASTSEVLDKHCAQPYPFEHPFYWSGFVCYGLR